MARVVNLVIDQGSRWQAVIDAPVEWLPTLAGYDARGTVRASRSLGGAAVLADLTPYLTVNEADSVVEVDIPANVSAAWTWTEGVYDLELFDSDPEHDVRFLQGKIKVDKEVTT
jgi:hypothetical protein